MPGPFASTTPGIIMTMSLAPPVSEPELGVEVGAGDGGAGCEEGGIIMDMMGGGGLLVLGFGRGIGIMSVPPMFIAPGMPPTPPPPIIPCWNKDYETELIDDWPCAGANKYRLLQKHAPA
jgi:hypothetical protein